MSNAVSFREIVKEKKRTGGTCELSLAEYVRPFVASGEEITVSGKGTSMLPTITEECTLVMAPLPQSGVRAGDILLYARPDGQPVIHRVWRVTARGYDMVGDNQFLIERNVSKAAAVAWVRTIRHPDGTQRLGYVSAWRVRARYIYRYARRLAGKVYRRVFRK